MTIEQILEIIERYKLRMPPTVYYELLADVQEAEEEQEPKIGYWIERHDDWGSGIITDRRYKCSVCHGKHIDPETGEWHEVFDYKYPFCPNCGCRMVDPQESEAKDGNGD